MIKTIQLLRIRRPFSRAAANCSRVEISRRWVETGDERCPLACVWFALPEIAAQDDESESARPAFSWFRSKAGYLLPVHTPPATSILA
jgi:hypothetical protein